MHAHRLSLGLLAGWFVAVIIGVGYLLATDRIEPIARPTAATSTTTTQASSTTTQGLDLLTTQPAPTDTEATEPPAEGEPSAEPVVLPRVPFTNIFGSGIPVFMVPNLPPPFVYTGPVDGGGPSPTSPPATNPPPATVPPTTKPPTTTTPPTTKPPTTTSTPAP